MLATSEHEKVRDTAQALKLAETVQRIPKQRAKDDNLVAIAAAYAASGKPDKARTYFRQIETDKDESRYKAVQEMIDKAGK